MASSALSEVRPQRRRRHHRRGRAGEFFALLGPNGAGKTTTLSILTTTTPLAINLAAIGVSFLVFLIVGTALFVRAERNR